MHRFTSAVAVAAVFTGAAAPAALAQGQGTTASPADAMKTVAAGTITWADANVPGFPPGMKIAVIYGNPDSAGPYTLRLSFPDGYRFPAHWHPMPENVTVLSGTLQLGMGEKADDSKLAAYGVGDFLFIPATKPHFGGAKGATVIQLHGRGPFAINVVGAPSR